MRSCSLAVAAAVLLPAAISCQVSTPAFWKYAPVEPALLVGIDWRQASQSSMSGLAVGALRKEAAGFDFAEEIGSVLVAAEPGSAQNRFLAAVTGKFNLAKLRKMAAAEGAKVSRYRGAEVFSASGTDVVVLDGLTLLAGDKASVRAALDRGAVTSPRDGVLWRRAAELSSQYSIWVASPSLQALQMKQAGAFADVRSFDGGIALQRGMDMAFNLSTSSEDSARALATLLEAGLQAGAGTPEVAELLKAVRIQADGAVVRLAASIDGSLVESSMKTLLAAGLPAQRGLADWMITGAQPAQAREAPAARPVAYQSLAPPPPPEKRVIRIVGLEDGTREIPYPASQR